MQFNLGVIDTDKKTEYCGNVIINQESEGYKCSYNLINLLDNNDKLVGDFFTMDDKIPLIISRIKEIVSTLSATNKI
jgi:hypothetical protein